jgi:hypothetical protein
MKVMHQHTNFEEILKNDQLRYKVDQVIEQRIMYHYQLKASSSKIKKNQIFPFVDVLFRPGFSGFKIALATMLVIITIGYTQFNAPEEINLQTDTAAVTNLHDTLSYISTSDSIQVY